MDGNTTVHTVVKRLAGAQRHQPDTAWYQCGLLILLLILLVACGGEGVRGSNQARDPVIQDVPIAYVVRHLPEDVEQAQIMRFDNFQPGARLLLRSRAAPRAEVEDLGARVFAEEDALYDVRDLSASHDGLRLVFAMRGPFLLNLEEDEEQPETWWNLWEYDIPTDTLYPLMPDAMANVAHDIDPIYLPDDRILFSSTRQHRTRAILLDEGRPQYAYRNESEGDAALEGDTFVLHTMELDANRNPVHLEQVTFNQSHDTDPWVMDDGRIVFSRWDNYGPRSQVSLYAMRPDGSELEVLYGYRSHQTGSRGDVPTCEQVADEIAALQQAVIDGDVLLEDIDPIVCEPGDEPVTDPVDEPVDDTTGEPGTDGTDPDPDTDNTDGTDTDGGTDTDDGTGTDGGDTDGTTDEPEPLPVVTADPPEAGADVEFLRPIQLPDGRLLAMLRPLQSHPYEVELISIDQQNYVDANQEIPYVVPPVDDGDPDADPTPEPVATADGQQPYTSFNVTSDGTFTRDGRFTTVYPLFDGTQRALVGWAPCRIEDVLPTPEPLPTPTPEPTPLPDDGEDTDDTPPDDVTDPDQAADDTADEPAPPETRIRTCVGRDLALPDVQESEAPLLFGLWMFDLRAGTQVPVDIPALDTQQYFAEVVVLAPRPVPPALQDTQVQVSAGDANCYPPLLEADTEFGLVSIRSVYDMDGMFFDWNLTDLIRFTPSPATTLTEQIDATLIDGIARAARFVRFEKAVPLPGPEVKNIPGYAFGDGNEGMREIMGYARIEPDGSVLARVPADVAFTLSVVDQFGRRLHRDRHRNWMQIRPGEVLSCNGCHDADSVAPHGRPDAMPLPVNRGADTSGAPYPNTAAAIYTVQRRDGLVGETTCFPDMGETMAETRARLKPAAVALSPDIQYQDDWTDSDVREPDVDIRLSYEDLLVPPPYNSPACDEDWQHFCRININYEQQLQTLWDVSRPQVDEAGEPIVIGGQPVDFRCTQCHTTSDAGGNDIEPAAQLNLTDERAPEGRLVSYSDLMGDDFILYLNDEGFLTDLFNVDDGLNSLLLDKVGEEYLFFFAGELREIIVDQYLTDDEGNPILDQDGDQIPLAFHILESAVFDTKRLVRTRALDAALFESVFRAGNGLSFDHSQAGVFSDTELRLIWEWIDLGWQYYNEPFLIPDN